MKIVYIDVQNTHKATKKLGWLIDRGKLFIYLKDKCRADIIYYAVWYRAEYTSHYNKLQGIWYMMLYKTSTLLPNGEIKGNVDIDIAIRAVFDICEEWLTKAYLITNDGDYNTLVDVFQHRWVFGYLMVPDFASASRLLKKSAWWYVQDIQRIKHIIWV